MNTSQEYDVVIVGAGIVGLATACQLSAHCSRILLLEHAAKPSVWVDTTAYGLRVSALNLASIELLDSIDVWTELLNRRVCPFQSMCVWDEKFGGEIHFHASDTKHEQLGFIVENDLLRDALLRQCDRQSNIDIQYECMPVAITPFSEHVLLETSHGKRVMTKLVLAADGKLSHTRELAGIGAETCSYQQDGLVAVCKTENDHQNTAWQCFTERGPLAMLPLADHLCSMVWSLPESQTPQFMQMDSAQLEKQISRPMFHHLGAIQLESELASFPLEGMQAKQFVKDRVVLLGDAAHQVHPLAGQGLNLGLADVRLLTELLTNTTRSFGSARVLRKYERERRAENGLMQTSFEWIDRLFRAQPEPVSAACSAGFRLLDRLPVAKRVLMRKAIGLPL